MLKCLPALDISVQSFYYFLPPILRSLVSYVCGIKIWIFLFFSTWKNNNGKKIKMQYRGREFLWIKFSQLWHVQGFFFFLPCFVLDGKHIDKNSRLNVSFLISLVLVLFFTVELLWNLFFFYIYKANICLVCISGILEAFFVVWCWMKFFLSLHIYCKKIYISEKKHAWHGNKWIKKKWLKFFSRQRFFIDIYIENFWKYRMHFYTTSLHTRFSVYLVSFFFAWNIKLSSSNAIDIFFPFIFSYLIP